ADGTLALPPTAIISRDVSNALRSLRRRDVLSRRQLAVRPAEVHVRASAPAHGCWRRATLARRQAGHRLRDASRLLDQSQQFGPVGGRRRDGRDAPNPFRAQGCRLATLLARWEDARVPRGGHRRGGADLVDAAEWWRGAPIDVAQDRRRALRLA